MLGRYNENIYVCESTFVWFYIYAYMCYICEKSTEHIESIMNCSESHIIHHTDHTPYIICIIFFKALDMALQISLIFKLSLQLHTLQLLNASHQGNVSFLQASSWRTFYSKLLIPVPSFFLCFHRCIFHRMAALCQTTTSRRTWDLAIKPNNQIHGKNLGGGFKYFLCSPPTWGNVPIWQAYTLW